MAKHQTSTEPQSPSPWVMATIIFAALFLVMLVWNVIFTNMILLEGTGGAIVVDSGDKETAPPTAPSQVPPPTTEVSADDDAVRGDADAPVVIIEFSDYECPFCGRFYRDSYSQIKSEYIDTGKVKYVFRDFPLSFHQRAMPAAIAAECVGELADDEAYFDFHDLLFENQASLDDESLAGFAEDLGIDRADFDTCFADEDGSMEAEVQADFSAGQQAGVSGTPSFFINGKKIVGAQPFAAFQAAIDAELE